MVSFTSTAIQPVVLKVNSNNNNNNNLLLTHTLRIITRKKIIYFRNLQCDNLQKQLIIRSLEAKGTVSFELALNTILSLFQ